MTPATINIKAVEQVGFYERHLSFMMALRRWRISSCFYRFRIIMYKPLGDDALLLLTQV